MEQKSILTSYYENFNEDERLQSRHGSVEFLTTMRYIEKYLKPGMKIIEIGAGTGKYSHALAQRGYQVDAVELVEHNEYSGVHVPSVRTQETVIPFFRKPHFR